MNRFWGHALAAALLGVLVGVASTSDAATKYWCGDGTANVWDTTTMNWSTVDPRPTFTANATYTEGDDVIFIRDTPAARMTIQVQAGGVSPTSFRVDTQGIWRFSGGLFNAPLVYFDSSGGGSTLNFNGYTQSMTFSSVKVYGAGVTIAWNFGGLPGAWQFGPGIIELLPSFTTGAGFKWAPTNTTPGNYELTNSFICSNGMNNFSVGGGAGRTNIFSGNMALYQNMNVLSDAGVDGPWFRGTVTVYGSRTIGNDTSPGGGDGIIHWTDATFTGGANATNLVFSTSNANARRHLLPSAGTRFNVASMTVSNASVYATATNATEDYFASLRSYGGKVTIDGWAGPFYNYLYLQRGLFNSGDFATTNGARLHVDHRSSNEWVNLTGPGGVFTVGGGSSFTNLTVVMDGSSANGKGVVTGNVQLANAGRLMLQVPGTASDTFDLSGDLRLLGGSIVERQTNGGGRTVRFSVVPANTLHLGDGNPATPETITFVGGKINSGGPNESWGAKLNTVSDDGNVALRYEGPDGPGPGSSEKYMIDWQNGGGTVQVFRAGSGGTIFAPGTMTDNDGFVVRGPTTGYVFIATSPTTVVKPGLLTFAVNLANNEVAHNRGPVLVTGTNATFDLISNATIRATTVVATNGARVGGIGTFEAAVDVGGNSVVSPGWNSAGTLTVNSNFNFRASATYSWDYDAVTGDVVLVSGSLTLASTGTVNINRLGGPSLTQPMRIFTAGSISGSTNLSQWIVRDARGKAGRVQVSGNDVIFIPVPGGTIFVVH